MDEREQFNEIQRQRRADYEMGASFFASRIMNVSGGAWDDLYLRKVRGEAARQYPLRKLVPPDPVPDPHGYGRWGVEIDQGKPSALWVPDRTGKGCDTGMLFTHERLRVLHDLLNTPWQEVEDTEPEGEA
jgi:hypothetical protein